MRQAFFITAQTSDLYSTILTVQTERGASYMIHEHTPSVTIQDANANLWFPVERLIKTIAFRVKGSYVLAGL